MVNKPNKGRKQGSQNKLSPKATEKFSEVISPKIEAGLKNLNSLSSDGRVVQIRHILELLFKYGSLELREKISQMVFKAVFGHFLKLESYLNHVPLEKRSAELRQWRNFMTREYLERISEQVANKKR